jgi:hypothetical protein
MEVDRAVADGAAAGQRHGRFSGPSKHRPKHQDRGAHLADHVVGRDRRGDVGRVERHPAAVFAAPDPFDHRRNAELVEQMAEAVDVGEPRQIAERQFVFGEECAGQQRERGVLGARDRDLPLEALAALDPDAVHRRALADLPCHSREGPRHPGGGRDPSEIMIVSGPKAGNFSS